MNRLIKISLLFFGLLLQTLAHAGGIMAENAWVRSAPPATPVMAAYLVLHNHGDATQLTGVSSAQFARVELHRTVIENDMARMEAVTALDLPMHGMVKLEPNGLHLMLFDPKSALAVGDQVQLQLSFSNGSKLNVDAEVRAADEGGDAGGADPHAHHQH